MDFRKAFDRVWRSALCLKLLEKGIGGNMYHLIKDMYYKNVSSVKIGNLKTRNFCNDIGVKQGDGLSPTLFNIFIDDLTQILNDNECDPCKIHDVQVGSLLYADDLIIMSESSDGLRNSLLKLDQYCNKWAHTPHTHRELKSPISHP